MRKSRTILDSNQKNNIILKYKTGKYTLAKLGKEYNISYQSIAKLLRKYNINIVNDNSILRRVYTLNENYFDIIDTEEKAYFLGFLYADGYNYEKANTVTLKLQELDKEILEKFKIFLSSNRPLQFFKVKDNWQNAFGLVINSKSISRQLSILGCFQAKSLTLKFPTEEQVPSNLIRHFIRGYFDGDGCISVYRKQQINPTLISTDIFCSAVKILIKNKLSINCSVFNNNKNNSITKKLSISGNVQSKKFLDWLYQDATIYLERKYQKYLTCC